MHAASFSFRSGAYHNLVCALERSSQRVPGRHLKREGRSQRTELNEEIIAKVPAEAGAIVAENGGEDEDNRSGGGGKETMGAVSGF